VEADTIALLAIGLGVVALLGSALARRTGLPDPVALCAVGVLAGFLPGVPDVELPPDVVFLVFLPPLLYRSSSLTSLRTLRANAAPIALLSVGLVLATAFAVAAVVALVVPGLGLAEGLVLGAVLAPTDPVAAASVFSRLGAPRRVVELVESESLVNDATALVLFGLAVEAVVSGPPSPSRAGALLVVSILGGVAIGVMAAGIVSLVRRALPDAGLVLGLSLLTPYLTYVPAERLHTSGVLAVVTAGVLLGSRADGLSDPVGRLQRAAVWSLVDLLLNAVLFVLLGLQVRRVLADAAASASLLLTCAVVVLTVIGVRIAWQFLVPPVLYLLRRSSGRPERRSSAVERLLIGWTGMRGAVSLAAALSVPQQVDGQPFPGRPVILVVTVAVILATLVVQGMTLGPLLYRLDVADEPVGTAAGGRRLLAHVALARLDELEALGELTRQDSLPLRAVWQQAHDRGPDGAVGSGVDLVALRLDIARAQGEELTRRKRDGRLPAKLVRELRRELDLQEARLRGSTASGSSQPADG